MVYLCRWLCSLLHFADNNTAVHNTALIMLVSANMIVVDDC